MKGFSARNGKRKRRTSAIREEVPSVFSTSAICSWRLVPVLRNQVQRIYSSTRSIIMAGWNFHCCGRNCHNAECIAARVDPAEPEALVDAAW